MSAATHGVSAPLGGGAVGRGADTRVRRGRTSDGAAAGAAARPAATRVDEAGRTWIAGIGEPLPAGERLVWAGSPVRRAVARRIFKTRLLGVYFVALSGLVFWVQSGNLGTSTAVVGTLVVVAMALAVLAFAAVFAALVARSTVYAVTDRRVVLRIGVAVPAVLNIPLEKVESVDLRRDADGTGDVVLTLAGDDRIAYLLLWPHARPWRYAKPQPALRCVPDAVAVGMALAQAVQDADQAPAAEAVDESPSGPAGATMGADEIDGAPAARDGAAAAAKEVA